MRMLMIVAAVIFGGWYYFEGGRTLDESKVQKFYNQMTHETLSRNPQGLCNLLADDYSGSGRTTAYGQSQTFSADRQQACDSYHKTFAMIEEVGNKLGGIAQLGYDFSIEGIEIAPNKKSATIKTRYAIDIAGSFMNIRGSSTDTLIRRNGKVLVARSEDYSTITSGE